MTSARNPSFVASGIPKSRSTGSRTDGPRSATLAPSVRCAATGANTSRPWNVGCTGCRQNAGFDSSRTSLIPARFAAGIRRPLSGPMKSAPSLTTANPRREVPTPGSTTPTWTANGKCGAAVYRANAPSATFPGATSWRTSTFIPRRTPLIAATYSLAPKSVVSVTITGPSPPEPLQPFLHALDVPALSLDLLLRRAQLRLPAVDGVRALPEIVPRPLERLLVLRDRRPRGGDVPDRLLEAAGLGHEPPL